MAKTDRKLLELLVCPITKGPLELDKAEQYLISHNAKVKYPIRDGIPIMINDEAEPLEDTIQKLKSID